MTPRRTHMKREEKREPAQHVLRDVLHAFGVDAQPDVAVQDGLEVARQTMQHTGMRYVERQFCRSCIVCIGRWKP